MLTTLAVPLCLSLVLPPAAPVGGRAAARASIRMAGDGVQFGDLDGAEARIGIIRARWHPEIGNSLVEGAKKALQECGVKPENIVETEVPGSFELPLAARYMALSGTVDAIIPIGILIKGDTYHFEAISDSVSSGLMSVGLQTGIPITFGVLTCMTEEQAKSRSTGADNHGVQWGKAAVEMALLRRSAIGPSSKKFFMGFGDSAGNADKTGKPIERIGF
mmetsp:Transcript_30090/g.97075  ORF Transcript_30090/g.97075 Transcript_30090/m.97075 type:complete len:219 (+) Transcript_30090:37-693(+)